MRKGAVACCGDRRSVDDPRNAARISRAARRLLQGNVEMRIELRVLGAALPRIRAWPLLRDSHMAPGGRGQNRGPHRISNDISFELHDEHLPR